MNVFCMTCLLLQEQQDSILLVLSQLRYKKTNLGNNSYTCFGVFCHKEICVCYWTHSHLKPMLWLVP